MHLPPEPVARDLLPPLLACLPTSFISSRPPPALLPLLSPLLRQRVSFLSTDSSAQGDGWLPLLSWDPERATKLPAVVESMELEPHPVSGELEMEEVPSARYRKLDEETLQAALDVEQFGLMPVYLWCENDEHGNTGPGWKLTELRSLEDKEDDAEEWFDSQLQASDHMPPATSVSSGNTAAPKSTQTPQNQVDDDDEGDYWASYDRTPGRTPAQKPSPAPPAITQQQSTRQRSQSEQNYYARYGNEVQPALDAHDPDEATSTAEIGQSTLNGNSLFTPIQRPESKPNTRSLFPADDPQDSAFATDVEAPRPLSPTSSQSSVERLEEQAAAMSAQEDSSSSDAGTMAVKQHISTNMKSMFRLARSVGMERREFERVVRTELDVLSILEQDD